MAFNGSAHIRDDHYLRNKYEDEYMDNVNAHLFTFRVTHRLKKHWTVGMRVSVNNYPETKGDLYWHEPGNHFYSPKGKTGYSRNDHSYNLSLSYQA